MEFFKRINGEERSKNDIVVVKIEIVGGCPRRNIGFVFIFDIFRL